MQFTYIFNLLYSRKQNPLTNGLLMKQLNFRISIPTSACCCCSSAATASICSSYGATWPWNTRKSTHCGFSASLRAFYMLFSNLMSVRLASFSIDLLYGVL